MSNNNVSLIFQSNILIIFFQEEPDKDAATARSPTMSEDSRTAEDPSVKKEADENAEQEDVLAEKEPIREFSVVSSGFGGEEIDMVE